jgi:hypothetical protein
MLIFECLKASKKVLKPKNMIRTIIFCLFVIMVQACKVTKDQTSEVNLPLYSMRKGPCFGKCPLYTLKIYKDGKAELDAQRFNTVNGLYEFTLSKKQLDTLKKLVANAKFNSLKDTYDPKFADLPATTIEVVLEGKIKKVTASDRVTPAYDQVVSYLEKIKTQSRWMLIKKHAEQDAINSDTRSTSSRKADDHIIYEEIIIEPKDGVRMSEWLKSMEPMSVYLIKKISPESKLWLIGYDKTSIDPQKMLSMLKADSRIALAEFNLKVSNRSE